VREASRTNRIQGPINIHFNGLSFQIFQNIIHAQNPPRPDESGKLHDAQGTATKQKQRPAEARLRLFVA